MIGFREDAFSEEAESSRLLRGISVPLLRRALVWLSDSASCGDFAPVWIVCVSSVLGESSVTGPDVSFFALMSP